MKKALLPLLLACTTLVGLASCANCNVYNSSVGWYASTCRWTYYATSATSWAWQNAESCPTGYNGDANSNVTLPVDYTLQQCADACGAQTVVMGLPAKSVLWWENNPSAGPSGCQCYLWHLDNPNMVPSAYAGLTMADISCGTTTPTPSSRPPSRSVKQVSFFDSSCLSPSLVNVVPLNKCAWTWPSLTNFTIFKNCTADHVTTELFDVANPTCTGSGVAGSLPVGKCYKGAHGEYFVNSCEQTETSV